MNAPDLQQHPLVYVRTRQRRNIATIARGQTWYWESILDGNHTRGPRSHGYFTNRADAESNAELYFGYGTTVFLQTPDGIGNSPLRWGQADTSPDPAIRK